MSISWWVDNDMRLMHTMEFYAAVKKNGIHEGMDETGKIYTEWYNLDSEGQMPHGLSHKQMPAGVLICGASSTL